MASENGSDSGIRLVEASDLTALVVRSLTANGISLPHAESIASVAVAAERDGSRSHGLYRLAGCIAAVRAKRIDGHAEPKPPLRSGSVLKVDCQGGFAPLAMARNRAMLVEVARERGFAALVLNNCYHFTALWTDVEPVAASGMAVLEVVTGANCVVWPGARQALLGTNPIAFGWPQRDALPLVMDLSTSSMSRGDVELRHLAGQALPPGVAVDASGEPTTDAAAALAGGLLPFGGHKGAALCLMAELLAAPFIGDLLSSESSGVRFDDGGPYLGGVLMLAMDPGHFGRGDDAGGFLHRMRDGGASRLPSDRRYATRRQNGSLVAVRESDLDQLHRFAS